MTPGRPGATDTYAPAPGLTLAVTGAAAARAHFRAEYGPARSPGGRPAAPDVLVDVRFAARLPREGVRGGHKTVRWSVVVAPPGAVPSQVRLVLAGHPRRFALSLVQGFVVEPLVSLAAARAGLVLLPAAALEADGGVVVVLGRSGSGKTSVVVRAAAAGRGALGDDQVLVDAHGGVRSWPRRLRVYPDLRRTAPGAVAALPAGRRAALTGLAVLAAATRGWVAPSLPLAWADLGAAAVRGPLPGRRLVVVERGGTGEGLRVSSLDGPAVVGLAALVLAEQRARLRALLGQGWDPALQLVERAEAATLTSALAAVPAERWSLPRDWSAPQAVQALAARLGVPG